MNEKLKAAWRNIIRFRMQSKAYECRKRMSPPASPKMLEELRDTIGVPVPAQLAQSLRLHNGVAPKGGWLPNCGSLFPASVEVITEQWHADRLRETESRIEGSVWAVTSHHVPIVTDSIGEHTIYIDTKDGTVCCYVHAGLFIANFRYRNYADFLDDLLTKVRRDNYYEWPTQARPPAANAVRILNQAELTRLSTQPISQAQIERPDGTKVDLKGEQLREVRTLFATMGPITKTRTGAIQGNHYRLRFTTNGSPATIVASTDADQLSVKYESTDVLFTGGSSRNFRKAIDALIGE